MDDTELEQIEVRDPVVVGEGAVPSFFLFGAHICSGKRQSLYLYYERLKFMVNTMVNKTFQSHRGSGL